MTKDMGTDAQTTSEPGSVVSDEPLRTDDEGQPIYAEWDDDQQWSVSLEDEPTEEPTFEWSTDPANNREEVQQNWDAFRRQVANRHFDTEALLDGVEKVYSTSKAADFFGRSNQWMYWGLRNAIFTYKDGSPIQPERVGKGGRRRFTLPLIREIALSCYRRGNIDEEELQSIMAKILLAEFGERAFAET